MEEAVLCSQWNRHNICSGYEFALIAPSVSAEATIHELNGMLFPSLWYFTQHHFL